MIDYRFIGLACALLLFQALPCEAHTPRRHHRHLTPAQQALANARLVSLWSNPSGDYEENKAEAMSRRAVENALNRGADVDAKSKFGATTLMAAANFGRADLVSLLLRHGANVNAKDKYGDTALLGAAYDEASNNTIIKILVEHGADVNATEKESGGTTALMDVVQVRYSPSIVQLLMRHGANVNARASDGSTVLMEAAEDGRTTALRQLLAHGANPNAQTKNGETALMAAAKSYVAGDVDAFPVILRLLLAKGANINTQRKDGSTALMLAASYPFDGATVKLLLAKGANVNARDNKGQTALSLALGAGNAGIAKLLKAAGAK